MDGMAKLHGVMLEPGWGSVYEATGAGMAVAMPSSWAMAWARLAATAVLLAATGAPFHSLFNFFLLLSTATAFSIS